MAHSGLVVIAMMSSNESTRGRTMKTFIVTTAVALAAVSSAAAADLPVKAPRMAPAPVAYDWTGWYIGANAGYAWTQSTDTVTAVDGAAPNLINSGQVASSLPLDPRGFIGGGQFGYNWQPSTMWVVGFETDLQWADLKSTVALPGTDASRIMTATEKLDWFGTARLRAGIAPWDRALIYVTGGLAYGHVSLSTALTR